MPDTPQRDTDGNQQPAQKPQAAANELAGDDILVAEAVDEKQGPPGEPKLLGYGSRPEWGGGFGVFFAVVLFLALAFSSYSYDNYFFTLLSIVLFIGFMHIAGRWHLVKAVVQRPVRTLGSLVIYLAIGVGWMVGPYWGIYINRTSRQAAYAERDWLDAQGVRDDSGVSEQLLTELARYKELYPDVFKSPRVRDNRGRLIWAGALWPVSVAHSLVADAILESFHYALDKAEGWMDERAKSRFGGAFKHDELPKKQTPQQEPTENSRKLG